jgi:hypothetical protein
MKSIFTILAVLLFSLPLRAADNKGSLEFDQNNGDSQVGRPGYFYSSWQEFSHVASKTTAAAAGALVGIGMGFAEGGPFGAVLMAGFGAYSIGAAVFEGIEADKEEAEKRRADAETSNKVNTARLQLVRNLKLVDNDYDRAFAMLSPTQKKNINSVGAERATNFKNSLGVEFNPLEKERNGNPYAPKDPEEDPYEKGFFEFIEVP